MTERDTIPYGRQLLDESDYQAVLDVLKGQWLTGGPAVTRFEDAIATVLGVPHVVACSSGTAALHLACLGADLAPGDVVVVPAITFVATANAARMVGAVPVFADVNPRTGLMEPHHLEDALRRCGGRAKAVMPVHYAGQSVDMDGVAAVADAHGLQVIEDACHALGTVVTQRDGTERLVGNSTGSLATCFSFHPVKTIAVGEGGAIACHDAALAERMRRLRGHGIVRDAAAFSHGAAFAADGAPNPWYYEMTELGYNYRLSDINAALGCSQLAKLDSFIAQRARLQALYSERLAPLAPTVRPLSAVPNCRPGWHLNVVLIDFASLGRTRAEIMHRLAQRKVGTQVHYIPVPMHPYYGNGADMAACPGATNFYEQALTLPLHVSMTEADVDYVVSALRDALEL